MTPKLILSTIFLLIAALLIGTMTQLEQRTSGTQLDDDQPLALPIPRWNMVHDISVIWDPADTYLVASYLEQDEASAGIIADILNTAGIPFVITVNTNNHPNFNDQPMARIVVDTEHVKEAGILLAACPNLKGFVQVRTGMPREHFATDMNLLYERRIEPAKLIDGLEEELDFKFPDQYRNELSLILNELEISDFRYSCRWLPGSGSRSLVYDFFVYARDEGMPQTLWIQISALNGTWDEEVFRVVLVGTMPGEVMLQHVAYDSEGVAYTRGEQSMFR